MGRTWAEVVGQGIQDTDRPGVVGPNVIRPNVVRADAVELREQVCELNIVNKFTPDLQEFIRKYVQSLEPDRIKVGPATTVGQGLLVFGPGVVKQSVVRPGVVKSCEQVSELTDQFTPYFRACIGKYFQSLKKNQIDFSKLISKIDRFVFKIIDSKEFKDFKNSDIRTYNFFNNLRYTVAKNFCQENYRARICFDSKYPSIYLHRFEEKWEVSYRLRTSAGVILKNNENILFVVNKKNVLNFPMGKVEPLDGSSLKSTSLRELAEETTHFWHENDLGDIEKYVDCKLLVKLISLRGSNLGDTFSKRQRFYFQEINDSVRTEIDKNFKPSSEVIKLKWISTTDLRLFFNDAYMSRNYLLSFVKKMFRCDENRKLCEYKVAESAQNVFIHYSSLKTCLKQNNASNFRWHFFAIQYDSKKPTEYISWYKKLKKNS